MDWPNSSHSLRHKFPEAGSVSKHSRFHHFSIFCEVIILLLTSDGDEPVFENNDISFIDDWMLKLVVGLCPYPVTPIPALVTDPK